MAGIHNILAGAAGMFPFTITISADTTNYNLYSALIALGWDGIAPVNGSVSINSGVVVSSNSTSIPGFKTGGDFSIASDITLNNAGYIVGMGGAGGSGGGSGVAVQSSGLPGGHALEFTGNTATSGKVKVNNTGVIAGGGGGGGGAYSGAQTYRGPGGGGGRSGRTNSAGGATDYGSYAGTFGGPGAGLAPGGNGNSGGGGGWGGGGAQGSAWPGDYVVTSGGAGGYSVTGASGFTVPSGWGTTYGSITG